MKHHSIYLLAVGLVNAFLILQATAKEEQPDWMKATVTSEVQFTSDDGYRMFGKLVLPKAKAPRAIVVAVQTAEGSTVDMKRPLGRGRTFNYFDLYREKLTAMNIGFFSYEGRGIRMGDSPPRYEIIDREIYNTSTLDNKVHDLLNAIEAVRKQDQLSQTPILLLGASEGTLLAAEAAATKPDEVAGLVLYGVMAKNLRDTFRFIMSDGEFLKYHSMDEDKDNAITKLEWDKVVKQVDFSQADLNKDGVFTTADIQATTKKYLDAIDENDYDVLQAWAKTGAAVSVPDGWFKDHFSHADSWTFLSQLDIPVGLFHGDADRMAPISAVRELEQKAKQSKLSKMRFHYFEGLDHSLNIGNYFARGKMPAGHKAVFEFIDRVADKANPTGTPSQDP